MRNYATLQTQFWASPMGKKIRRLGPEAFTLVLHLLSSPSANMIGLYYVPVETIAYETGMSEDTVRAALAGLASAGFAEYDAVTEVVWVCEMAASQIGETVVPEDKRHVAILKEHRKYTASPLHARWWARYAEPFHLEADAASRSPLQPPPKPMQDQEQGQEQSKITPPTPSRARESAPPAPVREAPASTPQPPAAPAPKVVAVVPASLSGERKALAAKRLTRLGALSDGRFDPMRGAMDDRVAVGLRLTESGVDDDLIERMGELLREPAAVWTWAPAGMFDSALAATFLLGKADDRGKRSGVPLAQLLDAAKTQRAAEVARAEREAARRAQMEAQQAAYLAQRVTQPRVTPATMPTPAFARLRVAGREALTGQPAAAPQTPDKGRAGMGWADGLDELFAPAGEAAAA